jgi:hypothetical protein
MLSLISIDRDKSNLVTTLLELGSVKSSFPNQPKTKMEEVISLTNYLQTRVGSGSVHWSVRDSSEERNSIGGDLGRSFRRVGRSLLVTCYLLLYMYIPPAVGELQ